MSSVANTPAVSTQTELNPLLNQAALLERLASHPHPQRYEIAKAEKAKVELAKGLTHTPNHIDCPACMATDEILKADPAAMAKMTFIEAAAYWHRIRLNDPELKPRTHESVDGSLNALGKFFGHCPMHKISSGMIRQYQDARKKNELLMGSEIRHPWTKAAGNSAINFRDCNVLSQMLVFCGRWKNIAGESFPLRIKGWSPIPPIMSESEVEDFFERLFKANDDRANLAFWCAKATINTTASGIELRGLRIKNVMLGDLDQMSRIYIPDDAVKNNSRPRDIVLNDDARFAFAPVAAGEQTRRNRTRPLPLPVSREPQAVGPHASRGAWLSQKELETAKGDFYGRKDSLTHMLRHLAITTMLEKGVDQSMAKAIAGHVTQKMLDYYSHIRAEAQAEAVARIGQSNVIQFAPSRRRRA